MGNKAQKQKPKVSAVSFLDTGQLSSDKDRRLIVRNWDAVKVSQGDLFKRAWIAAVSRNNDIRAMFNLSVEADPAQDAEFNRMTQGVTKFFDDLITETHLEESQLRSRSFALGQRHSNYIGAGFQSVYWNTFESCLFESIKTADFGTDDEDKREALVEAWKRLVTTAANYIRQGYTAGYFERRASNCLLNEPLIQEDEAGKPTVVGIKPTTLALPSTTV